MKPEIFGLSKGRDNLALATIHSGSKQRFAAFREQDLGALRLRRAVNPHQPVDDRVFPDRLARAVALPGIHGLLIGARPIRYPSEKFEY